MNSAATAYCRLFCIEADSSAAAYRRVRNVWSIIKRHSPVYLEQIGHEKAIVVDRKSTNELMCVPVYLSPKLLPDLNATLRVKNRPSKYCEGSIKLNYKGNKGLPDINITRRWEAPIDQIRNQKVARPPPSVYLIPQSGQR